MPTDTTLDRRTNTDILHTDRPASPVHLTKKYKKMDNKNRLKPSDHIDKIAGLIRSLTNGETIEFGSDATRRTLRETAGETLQIDKIAELIRSLTYGEMIELSSRLQEAAGGTEITAETLPIILHRWACEHGR